ncbi:uracil-DNA glycosylase [Thiosulfativibrio zosterae]|uniref:uracil-DNA glycosylase n=1 Tax=Thiosulfativibrio zosterae TaxID=2675053 RepID=UPI00156720CA|nr:uracil-DNA glycosylase [Thiosulfativibrio zosterae]
MSKTNSENEIIDCFQCRHFYVTWEASNPKGCKAFGFKTHLMPSVVVLDASGEKCLKFSPKNPPPPRSSNKTGWVA